MRLLAEGGATPVHVPLIAFEATGARVRHVGPDEVLAITSATAVEYLDPSGIHGQIAAVGPSTRAALEARHLSVHICPERGLAEALLPHLAGRRVVYPRAEVVPPAFERALLEAGADVSAVAVYRTLEPRVLELPEVEVITLASGSAARHLARLDHSAPIVAIGPSTAAVCAEVGLEVTAVASPHTSAGLAEAALKALP